MSEQPSTRVGDYEMLQFLGAGGMGKVFKARNVATGRVETMKVLLPELSAQEAVVKSLSDDIKVLATLAHPNIATIDSGETVQGQFVILSEYVEGTTVAKLLESGPLPLDKALNYISQVLTALSYARTKGVIHRDLNPANMMLTADGAIKLLDFGISRSNPSSMIGTTPASLSYLSPEQLAGGPVDGRSDLYSAGVSLYEMVTGKKPFAPATDYASMAANQQTAPPPPFTLNPAIPSSLNEIIMLTMAKDPAARFQAPDAMRHALESVSASVPQPAPAPVVAPIVAPVATPAPPPVVAAAPVAPPPIVAKPVAPPPPPAPVAAPAPPMPAVAAAAPPKPQAPPSNYVPMPVAPTSTGHRGLYMTLGALIVVAVLVAAGLYVPKMSRTHAASGSAPAAQPAPPPVPAAATTPDTSAAAPTAATTPDATPAPAATSDDTAAKPSAATTKAAAKVGQAAPADSSQVAAQQAARDAAQRAIDDQALEQLDHDNGLLGSRITSADAILDTMKRSQAQAGYGLRGDISSAQERLHMNAAKLDAAIQNRDVKGAKHFMELCDRDMDTIDKFLGH